MNVNKKGGGECKKGVEYKYVNTRCVVQMVLSTSNEEEKKQQQKTQNKKTTKNNKMNLKKTTTYVSLRNVHLVGGLLFLWLHGSCHVYNCSNGREK